MLCDTESSIIATTFLFYFSFQLITVWLFRTFSQRRLVKQLLHILKALGHFMKRASDHGIFCKYSMLLHSAA